MSEEHFVEKARLLAATHIVRPALEAEKLVRILKSYASRCSNSVISNTALWTERYQPSCAADICGNRSVVVRLSSWLRECRRVWALGRDGLNSDDDSSDDGEWRRNSIVLSGPIGVGKTSLIHSLASELGFDVIEVSASDDRSGATIMKKFKESGESRNIGVDWSTNSKTDKLAKKRSKKRRKADCAAIDQSDVSKHRAPLILFDEADLLIDSDADKGFLAAVTKLLDSAKCPIVITVNEMHHVHHELKLEHFHLVRPATEETLMHLRMLCLVEGLNTDNSELMRLISLHRHDLRKILNSLQSSVVENRPAGQVGHEAGLGGMMSPHPLGNLKDALLAPITRSMSFDQFLNVTAEGETFHDLLSENYLHVLEPGYENAPCATNDANQSEKAQDLAMLAACSSCADDMATADMISGRAARLGARTGLDADAAQCAALRLKSFAYIMCLQSCEGKLRNNLEELQQNFVPFITFGTCVAEQESHKAAQLWRIRHSCPRAMRMGSSPLFLDYVPFFSEICRAVAANTVGMRSARRGRLISLPAVAKHVKLCYALRRHVRLC